MKKYDMPKMEISLFDVEVVATGQTNNDLSAQFNDLYKHADAKKTISWNELDWTY